MTTKTRKAPTGPKHDRCIGHVEHPYPAKGILCFGDVTGRDGMIAFADHLATVRAEHRAAFLAETPAAPDSWYVGTGKARKLRPIGEFRGLDVVPSVCDGTRCHGASVHAHAQGASVPQCRGRQDDGLPELVARFRAMRGLPAVETPAPIAEPTPVRKLARKPSPAVRAARRREIAAVMATIEPAPIAEPIAETPAEPTYCAGTDRAFGVPYENGRLGGAERAGMERCPVCGRLVLATLTGRSREVRIARHLPLVAQPDTYAAAVELAETRPDPCAECGHPAHGATCATCDDAAQIGTYAPCANVAPVSAPAEPIDEPAPVLSAPAPVQPVSGRPTCERCGQAFRKSGSGAEWHRVNRPDCAALVAVAV